MLEASYVKASPTGEFLPPMLVQNVSGSTAVAVLVEFHEHKHLFQILPPLPPLPIPVTANTPSDDSIDLV